MPGCKALGFAASGGGDGGTSSQRGFLFLRGKRNPKDAALAGRIGRHRTKCDTLCWIGFYARGAGLPVLNRCRPLRHAERLPSDAPLLAVRRGALYSSEVSSRAGRFAGCFGLNLPQAKLPESGSINTKGKRDFYKNISPQRGLFEPGILSPLNTPTVPPLSENQSGDNNCKAPDGSRRNGG